jgi:hypothetical protein
MRTHNVASTKAESAEVASFPQVLSGGQQASPSPQRIHSGGKACVVLGKKRHKESQCTNNNERSGSCSNSLGGHSRHVQKHNECIDNLYRCLDVDGVGPQTLHVFINSLDKIISGGPIQRLHSWLVRMRRQGASVPIVKESVLTPSKLLPTHLPARPLRCDHTYGRESVVQLQARQAAWNITEWLLCIYTYYECGCPKSPQQYLNTIGPYKVSEQQVNSAHVLYESIHPLCQLRPSEGWTRGRKSLIEALSDLTHKEIKPGQTVSPRQTTAKYVDPDRISVPEKAGGVDPIKLLCPERQKILKDLSVLVLPEDQWPVLPRGCYMIARTREAEFRRLLLKHEMAVLIPEDEVPRDYKGRKLLSGAFCVEHKIESDRLIFDRRCQNATERRLHWCSLPHGTCFTRLRLRTDEELQAHGDDISNYFYHLKLAEHHRHRSAFGRVFTGREAAELGGDPNVRYHLMSTVWNMGDHNSVCVAQLAHIGLLGRHGAFKHERAILYSKPLPRCKILQGIYIDDHVVLGVMKRDQLGKPDSPDRVIVEKARAAYKSEGLPTSAKKSFDFKKNFTAWGTEVLGPKGLVGSPGEKRIQVLLLSLLTAAMTAVTKSVMQSLLGSLIFPLSHRKETMCTLSRVFAFVEHMHPQRAERLPVIIKEELVSAALNLMVATTNIRAPISTHITCSDATPQSAGAVACDLSLDASEALFDFGETKGTYARLDWSELDWRLQKWEPIELPEVLSNVIASAPWKVIDETEFRNTRHVNIQEAKAMKRVLVKQVQRSQEPERIINGTDSRVVLGAYAKGRSSSIHLNNVLRSCLGWSVLGRKQLVQFYLRSKENPADDPSRKVALRVPKAPSPDIAKLLRPHRTLSVKGNKGVHAPHRLCKEIYAGCGNLSKHLEHIGLGVGEPVEAYPNGLYLRASDLDLEENVKRLE